MLIQPPDSAGSERFAKTTSKPLCLLGEIIKWKHKTSSHFLPLLSISRNKVVAILVSLFIGFQELFISVFGMHAEYKIVRGFCIGKSYTHIGSIHSDMDAHHMSCAGMLNDACRKYEIDGK